MTDIATIAVQPGGDIGGLGVSRIRFRRTDSTTPTSGDCGAAGAALHGLINTLLTFIPNNYTWTFEQFAAVNDSATGAIVSEVALSAVPAQITGAAVGTYAAGMGLRIDWQTATVRNRRLMRGSFRFVPCADNAYTSSGGITGTLITDANSAVEGYMNDMTTANLVPVVWHRPAKGAFSGGVIGDITGGAPRSTPSGLRSRRS